MEVYKSFALKYLHAGYSPIPVNGKVSLVKRWGDFCKVPPTENQIEEWCEKFPQADIAICCGPASDLVAIDVDDDKIVNEARRVLPPSPCEKIGRRGFTRFYSWNGEGSSKIGGAYDILGEGSYTVIPPSIHPDTGLPYEWMNGVGLLGSCERGVLTTDIYRDLAKIVGVTTKIECARNNRLVSLCFRMLDQGKSDDDIITMLFQEDKKHKVPLFSDFNDTYRNNYKNPLENAGKLFKNVKKTWDRKRKEEEKESNSQANTTKLYAISQTFIDKYNLKFLNGQFYRYEDGVYVQTIKEMIKKMIIQDTGLSLPKVNSVMEIVTALSVYEKKESEYMLNIESGVLNTRTLDIIPHNPSMFFTHKLPFTWPYGNSDCSEWLKFLDFVLEGDQERIQTLRSFMAYCLIGGNPFCHKALVLIGSGRNGKSTFLDVFRALLGHENISAVSMRSLDKPFSVVMMENKLANIVEESPVNEINAEAFKAIVGGGTVTAAQKYCNEYSMKLSARLVFSCNEMPKFRDTTVGLLERLLFMPFNRYIKEEERDPSILREGLLPQLQGIFMWAVSEIPHLWKTQRISCGVTSKNQLIQFREQFDTVYLYTKTMVEPLSLDTSVKTTEIHEEYCKWCVDCKYHPFSRRSFVLRFNQCIKELYPDKFSYDSEHGIYFGIKLLNRY